MNLSVCLTQFLSAHRRSTLASEVPSESSYPRNGLGNIIKTVPSIDASIEAKFSRRLIYVLSTETTIFSIFCHSVLLTLSVELF